MDNPAAAESPRHVVAVDTYGTEQVFHPATRQRVSAIKCTRAAPDILKLLFGALAEDVTPSRASYSYIRLTVDYHLKKSYLIVRLTDTELSGVEALTRLQPYGQLVFLWRNNAWHEFPCQRHADYCLASATGSTSYLRFSGVIPALLPSRQAASAEAKPFAPPASLTIEQSGNWWWIGGETYPHREALSARGCRWSRKRKQWYYIGTQLPQAIPTLAESTVTTIEPPPQTSLAETPDTRTPGNKTLRAQRTTILGREYVGSRDYTWLNQGTPT